MPLGESSTPPCNNIRKRLVPVSDKYLTFSQDRHVPGEPLQRPSQQRRSTLAVGIDKPRPQSHGEKVVLPTVHECWGHRAAIRPKDDGTALHEKAGKWSSLAPHDQRPGDHSAARVGSGFAFDDNGAPAHAVAGTLARAATDNDHATAHSGHLSRQRPAETIVRRAEDFDHAAIHAGCCPRTSVAA